MTYLPLFFFSLCVLAVYTQPHSFVSFPPFLLCVGLVCLYSVELFDYILLNQALSTSSYSSSGLNTLLTNVLNRYHPFVFYLSTFLLVIWFFYHYYVPLRASDFTPGVFYQPINLFRWSAIFINLLALWMGSWWALQEGTWGGWWNWDSSEVFGLYVSLIIISSTHSKSQPTHDEYKRTKAKILFTTFFLSYLFIQLNFELVSHNFGSKFFFFFNNNLFFLQLSFIGSFYVFMIFLRLGVYRTTADIVQVYTTSRHKSDPQLSILRLLPSILLSLWVIISYKPLLNYFLWNFFDVNFFNSDCTFQLINTVILVTFISWFITHISAHSLFIILISVSMSHYLLVLITIFKLNQSIHRSHAMFIALLAVNIMLFDTIIYRWNSHTDNLLTMLNLNVTSTGLIATTPDSHSLEFIQSSFDSNGKIDISWNLATLTNVPSLNFFNLVSSSNCFYNLYQLSSTYLTAHLYIELPLIAPLNVLFTAPLAYFILHLLSPKLIFKY